MPPLSWCDTLSLLPIPDHRVTQDDVSQREGQQVPQLVLRREQSEDLSQGHLLLLQPVATVSTETEAATGPHRASTLRPTLRCGWAPRQPPTAPQACHTCSRMLLAMGRV